MQQEDNIAIRLKLFLEKMSLNNSQFADMCGIPRPTLSQLLNGKCKKVSDVLITQIHEAYPSLSISWLLFGEGDMLTSDKINPEKSLLSDNDSISISDFDVENPNFMSDVSDNSKLCKESGLKTPFYEPNKSVNQQDRMQFNGGSYPFNLENNTFKPKKVVKIMVYYDDNSYESFEPVKN